MKSVFIPRIPALLALLLSVASIHAAQAMTTMYEPADISEQAEDYVLGLLHDDNSEDRIEVAANPLDPRMGARPCDSPLSIELTNNARLDRQTTVMVACNDADPWRLYIPVRIQKMRAIVVAASSLSPGQVIGRNDVKLSYIDVNQLRDTANTQIDDLIGAQVKRRIGQNEPVLSRHTCFVCRGQDVTIVSGTNGLEVRASGVARSDGLMGERISVRNARSNKEVSGVVSGRSEVRVGRN
ncbi:flagellar basal body P-ring formation chaperone FlgA [Aliidiomarina sp. Khilg15.8]